MAGSRSTVLALIDLDRSARESLTQQIYARVRELIVCGRVAPGAQIPSTRALAAELGVSRNTVVAAFEQLWSEGYLRGKVGAGSFVASQLPEILTDAPRARPRVVRTIAGGRGVSSASRAMSATGSQLGNGFSPRAFALGVPAVEEFPHAIWSRLVAKRWRRAARSFMSYGSAAGLGALRSAVADYLVTSRGVRCDASNVFIVSGSQQALDVIARVLLDIGDPVWMEEPGYLGARAAFAGAGGSIVPVPVDEEGLDVAAAVALEPAPKAVYVTPSHQFPLGKTMSMSRRRELIDFAARADAWIIEDDYDSEFRYEGRPLSAIQGLDEEGRTVYVGTFSKVLLPGLRLGYVVVPPELVEPVHAARAVGGLHASLVDQAVVADFMNEGHHARHIRRMRGIYAERRDILVEALAREMGGLVEVSTPVAGVHLVAHLCDGRSDVDATSAAQRAGIVTVPLSESYYAKPLLSGLVLGYAGTSAQHIPRAVERLAKALSADVFVRTTAREPKCELSRSIRTLPS